MNYAKIMLAGLIRRIATSYSQGPRANRHVTTEHMQQFEDLKNATGLGSKGAFLNIRNMDTLEHNKEGTRDQREEFASIQRCITEIVHCQRCDGSYARHYFYRHQICCLNKSDIRSEPVTASHESRLRVQQDR